jgi:hypothetical protein
MILVFIIVIFDLLKKKNNNNKFLLVWNKLFVRPFIILEESFETILILLL